MFHQHSTEVVWKAGIICTQVTQREKEELKVGESEKEKGDFQRSKLFLCSRMSLKEKILAFNKPDVNEEELRAMQRKKASYNAKLAKFELAGEDKKRLSQAKVKAKMFEEMEGQEEREKEAEMRKEEFKKKKEVFKETDETCSEKSEEDEVSSTGAPPAEGEVSKKKAVFECEEDFGSIDEKSVDSKSDDEMTEALERERRREEFLEKQTLFGK